MYAISSMWRVKMSIISFRVSDEEKAVLEDAARVYNCKMSVLIKKLTFEKLEDEYDMKVSEDYLAQKKAGIKDPVFKASVLKDKTGVEVWKD